MGEPEKEAMPLRAEQKSWLPERWISFASLFVAACALAVSIHAGWLNRDYLRRSQRPVMQMSFFFTKEGSGFMFGNTGMGSAYLRWFQILVDGKPQPSWLAMGSALGLKNPPKFEFVRPGRIYRSDSYQKHFWVAPGPLEQEIKSQRKRVELKACYCSIFDECWIVSDRTDPRSISSCSPFPEGRYGGFSLDEPDT